MGRTYCQLCAGGKSSSGIAVPLHQRLFARTVLNLLKWIVLQEVGLHICTRECLEMGMEDWIKYYNVFLLWPVWKRVLEIPHVLLDTKKRRVQNVQTVSTD